MSTYEIIKAIPGKGYNWTGFCAALRERYMATYAEAHKGATPWPSNTTDVWDAAKGIRDMRTAAMEMACSIVHTKSTHATFIPPSPETLSWGGFLGGETVVVLDKEIEAAVTFEIEQLSKKFAIT